MSKYTAFVPLRFNSERIENKIMQKIGEKPLISYIFETLLDCSKLDRIVAFGSSLELKPLLPEGVEFLQRDSVFDQSETKGLDIYRAFAEQCDSDYYVLAHATSPFIQPSSIEKSIEKIESGEYDSALSVQQIQNFVWYSGAPLNYNPTDIPRTQDLDSIFVETSAFFIFSKDQLLVNSRRYGSVPYLCVLDTFEAVDIDTPDDLEFARVLHQLNLDR